MRREGAALMLVGDPGVGKTALLDAASAAASLTGIRVLPAAGTEFEADIAFATLRRALDPLAQTIARLSAPHQHALNVALGSEEGQVPERLLVSTATLAAVREASVDRPVLLLVDDLPWVDRASANVLGFVARRLAGSRIGFLGVARSDEENVFDRAGLASREVSALDEEAAAALVRAHFPSLAPSSSRAVIEAARGNPLALLEFGAALSNSQSGASRKLSPVLPQTRRLQMMFAAQIEELSAPTRRLLLLLALVGAEDSRIPHVTDPVGEFRDELAVAQRMRLVSVDPSTNRVEFRHPLIRSAAVELASEEERRRAHMALASIFQHDPDRKVWHLSEAATEPDEHVAAQLEQAAHRRLRRGDAVGAVSVLTRAAQLSAGPADRGRRLAQAAYIGADVTGELRNVSSRLADAGRSGAERGASLETAAAAAFLLLMGDGDVHTAHGLLVGAIEHHAETHGAFDLPFEEALNTLLRVCYFGGRAELWEPLERALERLGPDASAGVDIRAMAQGNPIAHAAEVLPRLDAAISALANETNPTRIIRVATAGYFVDRLRGCRHALWRLVRDARVGGAVSAGIGALILLGLDDYWTGQWDEAEKLCEEAADLCEARGYTLFLQSARQVQALVAAARGDSERTRSLTTSMLEWAGPRGMRSVQLAAWHARALAASGRGDFEDAYKEVTKITPAGVLESHNPYVLSSAMDLVEAAFRSGRHQEAAAHADALRKASIGAISSRLALVEQTSTALVSPDATSITLFEQALAIPGIDRWPFELGRVRLIFGERLRRVRSIPESRLHLNAALDAFERLGANPWSRRAAAELRASGGVSRPAAQPRREPLTPREREIAELAAGGLTNKEIGERLYLSHRTIGGHLNRIFPKLGVTSRAALRDALDSLAERYER